MATISNNRLAQAVSAELGIADEEGRGQAPDAGVVVIGRNEGQRLFRCLVWLRRAAERAVYADSGSTDSSVATAKAMGFKTISLDAARPFSAARARNEGFRALDDRPGGAPKYVQFVDGDCELQPGWIEYAARELNRRPDVAVVCGRLRERRRNSSFYARLCDMEWRRPPGPMETCGGVFMIRASAFRKAAGFREEYVVGEEHDLCTRLTGMGWKLERLDAEMGTHDSGITRFTEWWTRAVRCGYAHALAAALSGGDRGRAFVRERWSAWMWAGFLPLIVLGGAWPTYGLSLLLLGAYPIQALRIARARHVVGESTDDRYLYGAACVLSKFPHFQGQMLFALERLRSMRPHVIEYHREAQAALSS